MIRPKASLGDNMSNTSSIRLFDPVYIIPKRDANARDTKLVNAAYENKEGVLSIKVDIAWKDIWISTCHQVTNFAEFIFDFGQGAAYSITPRELEGARFIEVRQNPKHWSRDLLQAISLIAVTVLTCGIGFVALLWVKDRHHGQVIQADKVQDQAFKDQVTRKEKESIISLFDDLQKLLDKYVVYEAFGLNPVELKAMSDEIQSGKSKILAQEKKPVPLKGNRRRAPENKTNTLDPVLLSSTLREQLPNAVLIPLRKKLLTDIDRAINSSQESALANSSNNTEQEIKLKKARDIQADLQAIEKQIEQILGEENPPKPIVTRCNQQIQGLEFTKGLNDGVFKAEEAIVVEQAKIHFGKLLTYETGKVITVPNNGSCLLLSLVCSGNPEIEKTPSLWNEQAFELRQKLVRLIREKIENGDDLLKAIIQSEMGDKGFHTGYTEELKSHLVDRHGQINVDFINSENEKEGWQAYLKSLKDPATFLGQVELQVLPELVEANVLVYKAKLDELPIKRDEDGRLHVLSRTFAKENKANYVYSKQDVIDWLSSHKRKDGKVLPTHTLPETKPYERDICVVLRGNHYDLLMPNT